MRLWDEAVVAPSPDIGAPKRCAEAAAKAADENPVAWELAVCLINQARPFEPLPAPTVAGLMPSLPEGLRVCCESLDAATVLQGTSWIAFTSDIKGCPPGIRAAKQPNGHARIRTSTAAEIKRSTLGKSIAVLFVGAGADPELLRQFSDVAVVVLEVDGRRLSAELLRAIPIESVVRTCVYKGDDDVTQASAHIVFFGGAGGAPPAWPVKGLAELTRRCELKLTGALDLFAYFTAMGVVTRDDAQSMLSNTTV